ncbi:MAG: TIGR00730 family Rossman fold protein [Eubacteriaceae bacterium]|nr:TIGR00730 family Rossman fold protein [Eubacteriaceae bacterium]
MNITVYCGARAGKRQSYGEAAAALGDYMAKNGHTLIYGAGCTGMMGIISEHVLAGGGAAIGVVPDFLDTPDMVSGQLTEKCLVNTMAERKRRMFDLGDMFVALPGGLGTLEEITDIISWRYLNCHDCVAVFLNIDGFFDPIKAQLTHFAEEGFLPESRLYDIVFADTPEALFCIIENIEKVG